MLRISRRAALAGGTVASALAWRKSHASEMGDLSDLKLTQPPAPVPDVTFTDADGKTLTLSEFRGSGLVVNLWATWCAPCVAELPSLDRLAAKLPDKKVQVLALSSDRGGAPVVTAYFKQHGINRLRVLLDPQGAAMRAFKARGVPTTFLIDAAGMERAFAEGSENWATDTALKKVLELIG